MSAIIPGWILPSWFETPMILAGSTVAARSA